MLPSVHVLPRANANMPFAWQELSWAIKISQALVACFHVFTKMVHCALLQLLQAIKAEAMLLIEQLLDRAFGFEHRS